MILFVFCQFICVYYAFILFFDTLWKESVVFSFRFKNLFCTKCLKILAVLDKILSFFCNNVVAMTKIIPNGVQMKRILQYLSSVFEQHRILILRKNRL